MDPAKKPLDWLFHACLLILGAALALTVAVQLLACIWPWLVGIGLTIVAIVSLTVVLRWRRNRW